LTGVVIACGIFRIENVLQVEKLNMSAFASATAGHIFRLLEIELKNMPG
jgi:hypothetical protein